MYRICTVDGELIAADVSRPDLLRLRGLDPEGYRIPTKQKLIRIHPKLDYIWFASDGVAPSVILTELRRDIQQAPPVAEANTTSRRQSYVTANGKSGWYFELNAERCFTFTTYDQSAMEMLNIALRSQIREFIADVGTDVSVDKFCRWLQKIDKATKGTRAPIRLTIRKIENDLQAYRSERLTLEEWKIKLSAGVEASLLRAA